MAGEKTGTGFLPRLLAAVREEMRVGTLYRPDCCIAATAVLIDVLDHFKLTAKPLSVTVCVYNPLMTARIEKEGMPTLVQAERDWFPQGCHSVGVGCGDPQPGKWPGHLVATLGGKVLMDLTLCQADRPEKNIVLPPFVLAPYPHGGGVSGIIEGCLVVYKARPDDRSFEASNDWRMKKRRTPVVAAAIRRMKEKRQ